MGERCEAAGVVAAGAARAGMERARLRGVNPLLRGRAQQGASAADVTVAHQKVGVEVTSPDGEALAAAVPEPDWVPEQQSEDVSVEEGAAERVGLGEGGASVRDRGCFAAGGESVAGDAERGGRDEVIEHQLTSLLEFVQRRLAGDYLVDEFGFDEDFCDTVSLGALRVLYRHWFRVEVRGIEHVPADGGALVVANHSGTLALDALMTAVAVHDEHPGGRFLRTLGADLVFRTPVLGMLARKVGATLASHEDAERLLRAGHLVGVWPEGFKGIGKPFSERYKLQRFGRGGFVSAALRTGVPIVPCAIVGAEEIYPIVGKSEVLARLFGVPYWPITPTWPWLGPLGLVPLPSKWIIEFCPPIWPEEHEPGAEDDPMVVFDVADRVRETIQESLYSLLVTRRGVFS